MSGPKRGRWYIVYNPTPARLADLDRFAAKLDAWLAQHGQFLRRYLGEQGLAAAVAARDAVQECIDTGDPDAGFDAYGDAWTVFNHLYRKAVEVRQRRRLEDQRREKRAAAAVLAECEEAWESAENQTLLRRWSSGSERKALSNALNAIRHGSPADAQRNSRAWRDRFERVLQAARRRATGNARAVKALVPALRSATKGVSAMNAAVLPEEDRRRLESNRAKLRQLGEDVIEQEDLETLRKVISLTNTLIAEYGPKIKAAELRKATEAWQAALVKCGYAVKFRTEPDGTAVLEASRFPMNSVNVRVRPESREVDLVVNGKEGHWDCVKDVRALQAELARQGMELEMTDWGKGSPGGLAQHQTPRISIGGTG